MKYTKSIVIMLNNIKFIIMKLLKIILLLFIFTFTISCKNEKKLYSENHQENKQESKISYEDLFKKVDSATTANIDIWDRNLYGPVLLVNPKTREFIANTNPEDSSFSRNHIPYRGVYPDSLLTVGNTKVNWKGKTWAMALLPLSDIYEYNITVIIHELSHVGLVKLGFPGYLTDVSHLATKQGRILIRLELELLKKHLASNTYNEEIIIDALMIRKLRYEAFPDYKNAENQLELNEGLADYSGSIMSRVDEEKVKSFYTMTINSYFKPKGIR